LFQAQATDFENRTGGREAARSVLIVAPASFD
jgi:hypothetical protein